MPHKSTRTSYPASKGHPVSRRLPPGRAISEQKKMMAPKGGRKGK